MTAIDVAAHWHEHFRGEVSDSEKTLNDQAVCFFHVAQGADLGTLVVGRRGLPTRFDFDVETSRAFVEGSMGDGTVSPPAEELAAPEDTQGLVSAPDERDGARTADSNNRVFITHGTNRKILEQLKELVTYGKFEPIVAIDRETAAKPVPQKVMSDMRTCRAAVIHVGAEDVLYDKSGNEVAQINDNVLIEIGAAMALYGEELHPAGRRGPLAPLKPTGAIRVSL